LVGSSGIAGLGSFASLSTPLDAMGGGRKPFIPACLNDRIVGRAEEKGGLKSAKSRKESRSTVHWIDVVLLLLIGGLTYAGYKRGLVVEVFDWIMLIVASTLTLRSYRIVAGAMRSAVLKGWDKDASEMVFFWLIFLPLCIVVITMGLHLDRVTREEDRIPEQIRNAGGGLVAFFKSLVLGCLLVAWLPTTHMLADSEKADFRHAAGTNIMRGLDGPVSGLIELAAPSDLAQPFIKQMKG
jgi:hypothetical protein